MKRNRTRTSPNTSPDTTATTLPTFMDHVRELQGRLFAVAIAFVVFSAAAYPFFDTLVGFLLAPLGKEHELVYLTPGGAFSFIIQVCMYVGFIAALPIVIYNFYKFIMPVMNKVTLKMAVVYMVSSFVLALAGMLFAYFVSLPAALYFLTSFDLYHINPMLTVDSYFSFIMTYMLVGALLFQIPLVMLLINGATPLKPKKLMAQQGKIILGSFIVAAVVSPTPDALNQTLLASPMVVMYQIGILLVWLKNRRSHKHKAPISIDAKPSIIDELARPAPPRRVTQNAIGMDNDVNSTPKSVVAMVPHHSTRSVDGFAMGARVAPRPLPQLKRPVPTVVERQLHASNTAVQPSSRRSLDGFLLS